jgi:drug/metabolite transporter (DMT)-like permease
LASSLAREAVTLSLILPISSAGIIPRYLFRASKDWHNHAMKISRARLLHGPVLDMVAISPAAALALFPFGGHSTLDWALHYFSATCVANITLAEPIGSGILAFVLLGEMITGPAAIGAVLVPADIYVASKDETGLQAFTTDSTA